MKVFMLVLCFVVLPIAYLYSLMNRVMTKKTRGVLPSLFFFVAAAVTGAWALGQFRTDWAPVAVLGVPGESALAGFLTLGFTQWRDAPFQYRRVLAWVGLAASVLIVVFNVAQGARTASANRSHDIFDDTHFGQFRRDLELIAAGLKQHPGKERDWLDSGIRTRMRDSIYLSAALTRDSISPGLLDTLSRSPFQEVALRAIMHEGTPGETLARSYRLHADSDIFVQPLALNPHTPPNILREIYRRPHNTDGIETSLAGNPATPLDVLRGLAESAKSPNTIQELLKRETLDCALLRELAAYLDGAGKRLARDYSVIRINQLTPKVCSGAMSK